MKPQRNGYTRLLESFFPKEPRRNIAPIEDDLTKTWTIEIVEQGGNGLESPDLFQGMTKRDLVENFPKLNSIFLDDRFCRLVVLWRDPDSGKTWSLIIEPEGEFFEDENQENSDNSKTNTNLSK